MNAVTCDQVRMVVLDPGAEPGGGARRPEITAHIRQCPACQDWLDAFAAGAQAWASVAADDFTEQVIVRTSGVEAVLRDLPLLADMDPGPGFTERVLLATSKQPVSEGWRARAAGAWRTLVRRPRFAWEAAYLATVCWVLLFGNPVGAIEWSAANIGTVARERLSAPVEELRGDLEAWRARFAPEPSPALASATGRPAERVPAVLQAWQAAADWLRRLSSSVIEMITRAWDEVAARLGGPGEQNARPSTEPPGDAARSTR
jgi:hypothetical protein